MKRFPLRNVVILVVLLVAVIGVTGAVFSRVTANFQSNMSLDSASHLTELGNQVGRYVGEGIEDKWEDASVLQADLETGSVDSLDGLLSIMQRVKETRGYSDIYAFTESGRCYDVTGKGMNVDAASEMIYQAQQNGRYIKVVRSTVYYIVPIQTTLQIGGSKIVALSVVEDARSSLDNMNILSFNGQTNVYLVQDNGLIISRTSNADQSAINVESLFADKSTNALVGECATLSDALSAEAVTTFLHSSGNVSEYVVTTPVPGQENNWSLLIVAPEAAVNQSSVSYSSYLAKMSVLMIALIAAILAFAMYYLFRERLKSYAEVAAREQMLNVLISNTKSFFGLYSTHSEEAVFESDNGKQLLGDDYQSSVEVTGTRGKLQFASTGASSDVCLDQLNRELAQWDGTGEFTSSYLPIDVRGSRRYFVVRAYPSQTEDQYITMTQDVTLDREREDALRSALAAADYANQAKSSFLSNMSHDIRTPMNAIVNMTDFAIQKVGDNDEVAQYLDTIKTSSDHLLRLVNEVLDMSRIESGKTIIEREPFDLRRKLTEIEDIVRPICIGKNQMLTCEYAINHDVVTGDSLKLGQVLINLLNNAAKFTPDGGTIAFRVTETGTLKEGVAVYRFCVQDNGVGIAQGDIEKIFAPFSRVEDDVSSAAEGTGLGLSICRSFVDMMNGSISVESAVGVGSTFTVEMPFAVESAGGAPESQTAEKSSAAPDFSGVRALLVEDNKVNQQIARMMLEQLGMEVASAENGPQALEVLEEAPADAFDIVYMDIQMPLMNGYETTRAFRASGHPRAKSLPIVAMTANVFAEDVEKAREMGMDAHVGKPISLQELASATEAVLRKGKKEQL